jgi:hypothetical protein
MSLKYFFSSRAYQTVVIIAVCLVVHYTLCVNGFLGVKLRLSSSPIIFGNEGPFTCNQVPIANIYISVVINLLDFVFIFFLAFTTIRRVAFFSRSYIWSVSIMYLCTQTYNIFPLLQVHIASIFITLLFSLCCIISIYCTVKSIINNRVGDLHAKIGLFLFLYLFVSRLVLFIISSPYEMP